MNKLQEFIKNDDFHFADNNGIFLHLWNYLVSKVLSYNQFTFLNFFAELLANEFTNGMFRRVQPTLILAKLHCVDTGSVPSIRQCCFDALVFHHGVGIYLYENLPRSNCFLRSLELGGISCHPHALLLTILIRGWLGLPFSDSKIHGANMGPIWGRQDPGGPHVGPMNLAIWVAYRCVNVSGSFQNKDAV